MIPPSQWLMLWLIFSSYLFLGALLFYTIERRHEELELIHNTPAQMDFGELLSRYYSWSSKAAHQQLMLRIKQFCNVTAMFKNTTVEQTEKTWEETEPEFQWTFYNSLFFALTTLSTIGYGTLHPTSSLGRMLVIAYSLIGIPLNGIVLTQLGEFFAEKFINIHRRYKKKRFESIWVLFMDIITFLIPGVLLFVFLPSGFFVYFEGWTFEESIYFAYVTLTTIGYGDFIAGQSDRTEFWYIIYKIVLLIWILFGLGYLVMILGFISRAMRCKRMAKLEQKLLQKVWSQFTRDFSYLRRMLNEVYLLKFKPVYQVEKPERTREQLSRSQSAPNLTKWPVLEKIPKPIVYSSSEDEEETRQQFEKFKLRRRQALSENLYKHSLLRIRSDSDLCKIDKTATFNTISNIERHELLARVVDAFETTYSRSTSSSSLNFSDDEYEKPPLKKMSRFEKELTGIGCFSNEEILSSEWTEPSNEWDSSKNSFPLFEEKAPPYSEQWTWPNSESTVRIPSLNSRIDHRLHSIPQDVTVKRQNIQLPGVQSIRRMSLAAFNFLSSSKLTNRIVTSKDDEKDPEKSKEEKSRRTGKTACPRKTSKKRYSLCNLEYDNMCQYINYFTQTKMKESNIINILKDQIGNMENSSTVSPVLEQTSIGDFLRVVNTLHSTSNYYATERGTLSSKGTEPSPLFTLFQNGNKSNELKVEDLSNERRLSISSRRYSLTPSNPGYFENSGKKSFSTNLRKISPRFSKERTYSNPALSFPQIRRIRSESISNEPGESSTGIRSRKIRRFSVKPVVLENTLPEIVIEKSCEKNDIQVHTDPSELESVKIDK